MFVCVYTCIICVYMCVYCFEFLVYACMQISTNDRSWMNRRLESNRIILITE